VNHVGVVLGIPYFERACGQRGLAVRFREKQAVRYRRLWFKEPAQVVENVTAIRNASGADL
jgi:hypothetical protein